MAENYVRSQKKGPQKEVNHGHSRESNKSIFAYIISPSAGQKIKTNFEILA